MKILYVFGTILLLGGADSLFQDAKTDNIQQKILLRKLQNFEETKPTAWNEVLADVLVNKIRIFSFTSQDNETAIKDDAPVSKEKNILTDFFSKLFVVYKKFIYDAFVGKREANSGEVVRVTSHPEIVSGEIPGVDPEEVIRPTEVTYSKGPKSEVEFVEPKYHGKITVEDTTENPGKDLANTNPAENFDLNKEITNTETKNNAGSDARTGSNSDKQGDIGPSREERSSTCAEGFTKNESGDCVKNVSKLIMAIPNQCPIGYRQDWLGNCRKIWNF